MVLAVLAAPRSWANAQRAGDSVAIVHGVVIDSVSRSPLRLATVRLNGTTRSALTNDEGRFRIAVPPGAVALEVRRIGYRPATFSVTAVGGDTLGAVTVILARLPVGLAAVVSTAEDDVARRIMLAAIARKQQQRGQLHDYQYEAHVRLVANPTKPSASDSAGRRGAMLETVTSAFWEQPDHFQERILARRETANISAERNLLGAREIEDFSRDRISAGSNSLVSPIADDALDRYHYHVLDTLIDAGRRIIRLSLEPSSDRFAAFIGTIDIVDSTFDVAGFDVGVNSATDIGRLRDYRYREHFADQGAGRWMPTLISTTAELQLPFPFGGADDRIDIEYTAALDAFRFNAGTPPGGLAEYRIVVDDQADHADSTVWNHAPPLPPQTMMPSRTGRPDSVAYGRQGPDLAALRDAFRFVSNLDLFHFTRVDGWYLGAGWTWHDIVAAPWMVPSVKAGYALGSKRWEYRVGDQFQLSNAKRMWIGASYHDETITRPGITADAYNPSLRAVVAGPRGDGLDYYRERGFVGSFSTKLINLTQLDLVYTDAHQSSLALLPRYVTRDTGRRAPIPNRPIADGHLRSLAAIISYDSRPMIRQRGEDRRVVMATGTRLSLTAEGATPDLGGDFDYRRITLRVERSQELFGWGTTTLTTTGGIGSGGLPPQRYFAIAGGARILQTGSAPFSTLRDSVFVGNRVAVLSLDHNFGRTLFLRSGLPGIRSLPFTFGVHAGIFWTSFDGLGTPARDSALTSRGAPYREVGFSVGNLTPFLGIVDLGIRLGWQLSTFPTTPRRLEIGFFGRR